MTQKLRVDLQFFAGEKTEKATPKKREDTRKKGQIAKSQDVNTAISLLLIFLFFMFGAFLLGDRLLDFFKESFINYIGMQLTEKNVETIFIDVLTQMGLFMAPILAVAVVGGLLSNYLQVGVLFTAKPLQPKFEKIDPIKGAKRIFSVRALVELAKSLLKISLIGSVTFFMLLLQFDEVVNLAYKTPLQTLHIVGRLTIQMGIVASIVLLLLSLLDYLYQKYDHEKNIRMSKQDIKDEYKKSEGDPLIKSKIKQRQREMATRRMMQEVPNADVIITNPTHFAIALKYDESKMDAPFVVAKGVDFVAQKIKYVAKENGVTMVENRPLARALYDQAEIGDAVPEEFFKAVAEILAYVYKLQKKI